MTGRLACALVVAGAAWACGGSSSEQAAPELPAMPDRARTAGDDLLALAPANADAILELDLVRLRTNEVVGPLVRAVSSGETRRDQKALNVLGEADSVLICSYNIGDSSAGQLTIVRGPLVSELPGAVKLARDTVAVGPKELLSKAQAVARGQAPPLSEHAELLEVRARAMPDKAEGASIRLAAVLDFDARVALSRRLDLTAVPRSLSLWGDVVDDLAVVALLGGDDKASGRKLARAAEKVRDELGRHPLLRAALLGGLLRRAEISVEGVDARVVLVIGPQSLAQVVSRLLKKVGAS